MAIQAQLADGRILEFPDGTDPNVIQATVKRMIAESNQSSALVSGFKSYLPQLQETFGGVKTLLGVGAERVLGPGAVSQALLKSGAESMAEAQKAQEPLVTPERSSFTNALDKGLGSVLTEWLPYQVGSGAANLLESLGVMAAGSAVGSTAPVVGTIGGAATGLVAKEMAKKGIKEMTERILKEKGEDAAKTFIENEAKQATRDVAKRLAATGALGAQAAFYGTGQTTSRAVEEAEKRGETATDIELARVLPAAAVSTVAEFISDKIGLGAFKGLDQAGKNYAANIAKNIFVTGLKETPTEIVQSAAERFGAKLSLADATAIKEYIDATAASFGMSVVPGTAGGVRGTIAARQAAKEEAQKPEEAPAPIAPPETIAPPPSVQQRIDEATGVTAPAAEVTPMSAEEAEAAGAARQRETAERARIARLQQMVEADMAAQEERMRREGIQPRLTPSEVEGRKERLADQLPEATSQAELQAKQDQVDLRRLEAGLPTGASSRFPGLERLPQAPEPAAPKLVDERPMTERAAKNRLLVLKNMYQNAGMDPESIEIAPHPTIPERFVIQSLDKPVQLTPYLPESAAEKPPSPPVIDPVQAYVNIQRRTNTEAARRFVQDWEAGRITREDVETALEQERKTGRPAPLTFTPTGEPELMEPEKGYRARPEPSLIKQQLKEIVDKGEKFFVTTFDRDGKREFFASPFETLDRNERVGLALTEDETKAANAAQDRLDAATTEEQRLAAEADLRAALQQSVKRSLAGVDQFVPPQRPPILEEEPPAPPTEEPPPPTTEMPKTLEEFKRRMPIREDNAKLKAANNNMSFEDLAKALSESDNPVVARVGELAKKISKEVKLLKPKNLGKYVGGVYNRATDTVQIAPQYTGSEWINAHEVVHALVARSQVNPTPRQRPIVQQIEDLYNYVYKEVKRSGKDPRKIYGLTNAREFASEAMSNQEFQFMLMNIPYKGKRSAWTEFTRLVADLLGFKDPNALSEILNLVDRLSQTKRAPFSTSMFGELDFVVEPGQPPILDTTGLEIKRGRHPQLVAAATLLNQKKISREEYDRYVNFYRPIEVIETGVLTPPTSNAKMYETVDSSKTDSINAPVADGQRVGLRMDIPARNRGGMVVSIHEGASGKSQAGTRFSFQSTGHLTDVTFEPRSQKRGLDIAMGKKQEPLQTIEGAWINTPPDETFKRVKELMSNPNWVQVGFDPTRHGYFYDRKTKQPVVSASEVYQIGNFVLAKDVKYAPTTDFEYMTVPDRVEEGQPPVLDTTGIKPMKGRHPQVTAAARLLQSGDISRAEYDKYVNFYKPIATIESGKLEAPASIDTIKTKIDSNLQKFVGAPVADGKKVGLRLDIKARDRGAAVVTVHEGMAGKSNRGSLLSYLGTGYIKDVTFEPRSQARGLSVAAGGEKFPLQTSEGTWFNVPSSEVFKRVKALMDDPNWVQIGFDPTRHGYFYDRNTKQPVSSASEMYQVGNFLLAKDVTYASPEEFDYSMIPPSKETSPPKNQYNTLNGFKYYELEDGTVVDNLDPDRIDSSWDSVKEFKEDVPFAFMSGDKVGFTRAMIEEYGATTRDQFLKQWSKFMTEVTPDVLYRQQLNIQKARREGEIIRYTRGPSKAVLQLVEKEEPSDIDKMVMPEEATLPADAKPMDVVGFMGIQPQKQEEGIIERTKRLRQEFKEDPELTKASVASATEKFIGRIKNNVFSADSAFNDKVRKELIKDLEQNKETIGSLIEISQSQTVHSDAVAGVFIQMGGLRYDEEAKKWVGFQEENNFINLSRKIDEIADKYKLSKDEALRVAHAFFVAKRLSSLQDRNAELETEIASLPKGDPKIKQLQDSIVLIHLTDDQIQAGLDLGKKMPELKEAVDIWNGVRSNTVKILVQSGLWSDETANAMLDNIDYVPFYREEQIDEGEGPAEFVRGLQVKAKEYKLKGSENPVNDVFDNMVRWTQYAINRSIRNHKALQMIDQAVDIEIGDGRMAEKVKEKKKGENTVRVFRDGKAEFYRMADPLFMDAFLPVHNVAMPSLKMFSWFANILRQSVVLFPLFSVAQVPQDAFAAIFSSGLQPKFALRIPYLAVKEYVQTLFKTSALHNELKKYGVVGVRDFSSSVIRDDAEIQAGLKGQKGWVNKGIEGLQHISMAADNAVRQAVYDAAMKQGLSKAEALEKAFEVINFRRKPKSMLLNIAGQTIPFFYAYLAAQRVAYNTISGAGISPQERKAGLQTLIYTSGAVMALSLLYAMMNEDDEEYRNTPTALRDRTITIPGSGGLRIPLRVDFFLFPKVITEHMYHSIMENGLTDKTKFRTSIKDATLQAILAPGPFPQAVRAPAEVAMNYSFFQGRPLIGYFDQKKEAERQFNENTSELAKAIGSSGLVSPIAVDHLIRGMFGSVGGLFLWGTNRMTNVFGPAVERPGEDWRQVLSALPGTSGLMSRPNESALKNDFYQLRDEVEKAKNTFNDYKKYSPEGIEDFIANEKNMARLAMSKQVEKISDQLGKVRTAIKQVLLSPDIKADEKQQAIKELREIEKEMLKAIDVQGLRKAAQL